MGVTSVEASSVVAALRAEGCVFAEAEAALLIAEAATAQELEGFVALRTSGLPLEHVVGWAEFCGRRIALSRGVFVPRMRTEFLVECALSVIREGATVVDMCCGSGAIGAVLAAQRRISLHACDIDAVAVECARRNIDDGEVWCGDLFAALPRALTGRIDVLVVNAPYVPTAGIAFMPPEARLHEPWAALDGGFDGLDLHRRVAAEASRWLRPGAKMFLETSSMQADASASYLAKAGFVTMRHFSKRHDATVIVATKPAFRD